MSKKASEIRNVSAQIVEDLLDSILRGELKLGSKLPAEVNLAEEYGVSRPTVRSALLTLENEHILQARKGAHGGWYVCNQNVQQVATYLGRYLSLSINSNQINSSHLMEIRSMIEVKGSGLAALRRTPEDIQAIAAALPTGENLNDYEYHSQDIEFHRRVAEATHNPMLIITIQATTMAQELYAMTTPAPAALRQELNQTLMDIYQAIVQQDVKEAEKAMEFHLGYYKKMTANIHFDV